MSKKVLVFLSSPPKEPDRITRYKAPDQTEWEGAWTNDAPLRYLLHRHGREVESIICVVTKEAEQTYARLQGLLEVDLHPVRYRKGDSFEQSVLPGILDCLRPGDQILLETTGGFRNIVIDMLLLSRILSYRGIRTVEAVYSNYQTGMLEDVTHMYHRFDLVSGMQELTSFGGVQTLRSYYQRYDAQPPVKDLMDAMEQMQECIALCRTQQVQACMKAFNRALLEAGRCADPMLKALLPAFREKFGEQMTTLRLIRWCLENGMLQQALTIYNELIPEEIYGEGRLVWSTGAPPVSDKYAKDYLSYGANQLVYGVLQMSAQHAANRREQPGKWPYLPYDGMRSSYGKTIYQLGRLMELIGYGTSIELEQLQRVLLDYVYIRTIRNMTNHAGDAGTARLKQLLDDLARYGYAPPTKLSGSQVKELLLHAVQRLEAAQRSPAVC